ncbi:hypothetical protein [Niallia sp. NCCP-28]|uniref:hypothetical protein n=1 Tax=Niallia sp. NCCP-28 TaxID=2934712 RepID=UPI002086965A|nr:hypothetical protein [Niallia sp. NCCP-28]GKU82580.1 hypothetical protein NCCP28_19760 [Niallia sp. NCCP-28]
MKNIAGAIYISLGILLFSFENFENYYAAKESKYFNYILIIIGILYLLSALRDYLFRRNDK